ncbi:MAG TPA: adenylate/guanylate cyclase domain-containing protein [Methylomirabilota bacterium]|nr:adenylate/guanylate cyclase domain-containing protein [Methylomirabilota bacterium]
MAPNRQPSWSRWTAALLPVAVGGVLFATPLGDPLVRWSYDLPFLARPTIQPREAVMIYMDDESHDVLGQPYNVPWDRTLHARLVERLTEAGARVIAFDVLFNDPDPRPERDLALSNAIHRSGRVVLAADTTSAQAGQEAWLAWARKVTPPTAALWAALAGADRDVGSAEMKPEADFAVREHMHGSPDDPVASLSWAAARRFGAAAAQSDLNRPAERWVNYYGPPGTIRPFSYHLALERGAVPDDAFRDKAVFVGSRLVTLAANQRKDEFVNPYSVVSRRHRFMPGVEVQATIFLNLVRQDWLRRWPRPVEALVLSGLGAGAGLGLLRLRPWRASGLASLLILGLSAGAWLGLARGLWWFPWLIGVVQVLLALALAVVFNSFALFVQKRLYEQTVALYLSPKLVRKFSQDPRFMAEFLKPGAHKQRLTFLFSDIANFTSISEGMDSDDLALAMNGYFEKAISLCIHPTDGTVVKYIGDAIYALWNAPDHQPDHALRACRAALRFRDHGAHSMNGQPLITRIGLHTGVANVGNFGSTARFDYTALGENVNLASRMEGLNKYLGTTLLATGETCREAGDEVITRWCGRFRLKGFEKSVEVHELLGLRGEVAETEEWRQRFAAALVNFQHRRFEEAEAGFKATIELKPGDGPSRFYLDQIAELRLHPPAPDWAGEVELKEK